MLFLSRELVFPVSSVLNTQIITDICSYLADIWQQGNRLQKPELRAECPDAVNSNILCLVLDVSVFQYSNL